MLDRPKPRQLSRNSPHPPHGRSDTPGAIRVRRSRAERRNGVRIFRLRVHGAPGRRVIASGVALNWQTGGPPSGQTGNILLILNITV
jgi:hypothetical protein